MNKKVLITGSGGLIGSEAVEFYCKEGWDVYGIDNNFRQNFFGENGSVIWRIEELVKYKNYNHFTKDITNLNDIEDFFKKYQFDLIIHAAAQPSHDLACKIPILDFSVNANGTLNLLESYRKYSPNAVFIFTSTNKVYGDQPNYLQYKEEEFRYTPLDPNLHNGFNETLNIDQCLHSVFGASKVAADIMVQEYGKYFNLKTVVFRGGCLTGPKHSGVELHGFLSYLIKCCINDIPYNIYGYKGKQVRDNIHSSDLISAFNHYFLNPKNNGTVYNIGGGINSNCSVLEAISLVEKLAKKTMKIKFIDSNRIGDHQWWISDISKFKNDYPNWIQQYNLDKLVENFFN